MTEQERISRLERRVFGLTLALGATLLALALLAGVALGRRQLSGDGLLVGRRDGPHATLEVDSDGRIELLFADGKGTRHLELSASPHGATMALQPRTSGPERPSLKLHAGAGAQLELRDGTHAVEAMASNASLAQLRLQGAPGVVAELVLHEHAPRLTLMRGEAAQPGQVTLVQLAARDAGALLSMSHIPTASDGGKLGARAELWAGYPGGSSGSTLELHDGSSELALRTTPRTGLPPMVLDQAGKRLWHAP